MKKTWVEVLLELPVDAGLRDFLTDNGLTMPAGFTWTDAPETSQALVEALLTCADVTVRDRVAAGQPFGGDTARQDGCDRDRCEGGAA